MTSSSWLLWAVLSAIFAAATAIFAKVGVAGLNSDLATLIRTAVVICVLVALVSATGQWQPLQRDLDADLAVPVLSGLGTGASWLCYFRALKLGDAARVAPIDKLSVVFVAVAGRDLPRRTAERRQLGRRRADRRRRGAGRAEGLTSSLGPRH